MTVDKNYCMSSYLCFRYVEDKDIIFKEGIVHNDHELIPESDKAPCKSAQDIDANIRKTLEKVDLSHAAIFLSGGMDSAILASYMPKGTKAYTTRCVGDTAIDETVRARQFCDINGLEHVIVDVSWDDYLNTMDELMLHDGSPIAPNEPQSYAMVKRIVADGAKVVLFGNCADTEFGGMDKMLSKDWSYQQWINRYTFLDPSRVLKAPVDMSHVYDRYRVGTDGIDYIRFIQEIYAISSSGAYTNACKLKNLDYLDPYAYLKMSDPLDLQRVRSGDTKYLIRDLFKMRYPALDIPEKRPMSRPAEEWMRDWKGPEREEFLPNCVDGLTGEQKLLVYCLERFLNLIG